MVLTLVPLLGSVQEQEYIVFGDPGRFLALETWSVSTTRGSDMPFAEAGGAATASRRPPPLEESAIGTERDSARSGWVGKETAALEPGSCGRGPTPPCTAPAPPCRDPAGDSGGDRHTDSAGGVGGSCM